MEGCSWPGSLASDRLRVYVLSAKASHTWAPPRQPSYFSNCWAMPSLFFWQVHCSFKTSLVHCSFKTSLQCYYSSSSCICLVPKAKNTMYCNRVGLFTSQIDGEHLESRTISSLSFNSSFQLSGSSITFVEWVKNLSATISFLLGKVTPKGCLYK